jgi:Insertion element 4 transposase N-terminal/Transposase DDE domain
MARTKATLGTGARLSDYLSASLLARVYPAELVHELLNQHQCNSQRVRSFPAVAGVYYCMALSLYPEVAYEEVFSAVAQGLAWAAKAAQPDRVAKSSISALRRRIGAAPLQALHARACVPLADAAAQPQAFYAGLRLVAMDGSHFEIPDEAANVAVYGRPGSRTGFAAYPQAQCAVLVECATHAILGAQLGAYRAAEWTLCAPLLSRLTPDMLCLADRGFDGYAHWQAARHSGAQLLWRCKVNRELPVITPLADGSYLSVLYPHLKARRSREGEVVVRVIDYALPGANQKGEPTQTRYRLLTSLLDPLQAPALELARLYHERWEVEAVFDELKTHLGQGRRTLRSKTPEGVEQEFYGWVLAHYAVCWLMHQSASANRLRQRSLSFTGHMQLLRHAQPRSGAFPPSAPQIAPSLVC